MAGKYACKCGAVLNGITGKEEVEEDGTGWYRIGSAARLRQGSFLRRDAAVDTGREGQGGREGVGGACAGNLVWGGKDKLPASPHELHGVCAGLGEPLQGGRCLTCSALVSAAR